MSEQPMHPRPVALITGAARRVGAAIARYLHAQGYDLLLHFQQSQEAAQALQAELLGQRQDSVRLLQADLADSQAVRELAAAAQGAWGRLDVLINNASQFFPTPLASASEQDWQTLFQVNVHTPFQLLQSLADALRQTQGCVINLVDIYAERPLAQHSLYCASKAALVSLTRSMALELAPDIRVNAIAPGAILWPEQQPANAAAAAHQQAILSKIALGRRGEPEDIARAAWFLIDAAPYVTGQILTLDGGRSLTI